MGLIGAKRAIGFYTPVVMIFIYLIFKYKEKSLYTMSTAINILIISLIGVFFSILPYAQYLLLILRIKDGEVLIQSILFSM